jgi:hypothetical protein
MPRAFLKEPFLDMASTVWAMPEEKWVDDSPSEYDKKLLDKEGIAESMLDEVNLRGEMLEKWKANKIELRVKKLPGRTRLVFLGTDNQWSQIPWLLWSRIMQAIGHPVGHILFYAHPLKREFPDHSGEQISPLNINAGYSYICKQSLVVIYRFEEATRVLLHELLHTACFDHEKETVNLEASTEAWTELLLCAILSKGSRATYDKLWKKQCSWIEAQTKLLRYKYNVNTPNDYAWRYMVGKHEKLESMGLMEKCPPYKGKIGLRFTTPEWEI